MKSLASPNENRSVNFSINSSKLSSLDARISFNFSFMSKSGRSLVLKLDGFEKKLDSLLGFRTF